MGEKCASHMPNNVYAAIHKWFTTTSSHHDVGVACIVVVVAAVGMLKKRFQFQIPLHILPTLEGL